MFISEATGTSNEALIGIAPSVTGCIRHLEVGAKQYRLNTGAFLACDSGVQYHMIAQKGVGKVLFGGTGGLFVMETSGRGNLFVNAFGDMMELEVRPGRSLVIDNGHVVAWDSTLNYQIRIASGTFGFKSGEGLVNEFSGSGRVLVQTRNVRRPTRWCLICRSPPTDGTIRADLRRACRDGRGQDLPGSAAHRSKAGISEQKAPASAGAFSLISLRFRWIRSWFP